MSLVDRAKGILLTPRTEWTVIDGESATVGSLYSGYIIPLAAIPAIAGFIGWSVFGYSLLGTAIKLPIVNGIERAVISYILALVGTYVLALIIDALAPTFGGTKSAISSLKVAAYSSTASWVAGIFMLIPALSILGILGLYSLYLLYLGLPVLMKAPQDKAVAYTLVVIVSAFVIFVVASVITSRFVAFPGAM
jgi:Yip1-like protein